MSSRLLDIARKFNVFYLNGKVTIWLFVLISHRHFSFHRGEKFSSHLLFRLLINCVLRKKPYANFLVIVPLNHSSRKQSQSSQVHARKSRLIDFLRNDDLIRFRFASLLFLGFEKNVCRPFIVCGQQVGLIRSDVIGELIKYPEVFFIRDVPTSDNAFETIVELNPAYR
jgi:Domain of unknown function (DUF4743)